MPVDVWWYALVFQTFIFRVTLDTQYSFMSSVELFWGPDRKQRTKFLLIFFFFWLYWGLKSGTTRWSTLPALFLWLFFLDRFSQTACLGLLCNVILLISASSSPLSLVTQIYRYVLYLLRPDSLSIPFCYCGSVVQFKVRYFDTTNSALIIYDTFDYPLSFVLHRWTLELIFPFLWNMTVEFHGHIIVSVGCFY
jgi:hypothetical protein